MFAGRREPFRDASGRFISPEEHESLIEDERMREAALEAAQEFLATPLEEHYTRELARLMPEPVDPVATTSAPRLTDAEVDEILSGLGLVSEVPADRAPTLRIASSVMQQLNAGLPIRMDDNPEDSLPQRGIHGKTACRGGLDSAD